MTHMGVGAWRPSFLQRLNTPEIFTGLFSLNCFFLIVPYGILLVALPTLERIFNLNSRETALILMVNDVSGIMASLIMTNMYSARKIRWISIGNLLIICGYLIPVLSIFMVEYPIFENNSAQNSSSDHCGGERSSTESSQDWATHNRYYYLLFLIGFFVQGFGANAPLTAGLTYLDEIFPQRQFAVALAIVATFSFMGVPFGLGLGSWFLSFRVSLSIPEGMTPNNPEFLGNWWLGIILPSFVGFFFVLIVLMYPRQMPGARIVLADKIERGITTMTEKKNELNQSVVDVAKRIIPDFKRLLRNKALNFLVAGELFFSLQIGMQGYEPKVYAKLFKLKDTSVGMILGIFHGGGFILGLIIGGLLVKHKDWQPKTLSFIYFLLSTISIPFLFGMLLNCPLSVSDSKSPTISECNFNCSCTTEFYSPVCERETGTTYFSPCFAGCTESGKTWRGDKYWEKCLCVPSRSVVEGECGSTCPEVMAISLASTTIQQIIFYAGFVSLNVVFQRIVDESDRTIAQGFRQSVRKALGTIPSPLLFGWIIDTHCMIWKTSADGDLGNCWVYDTEKMVIWLCLAQVGLRAISSVCYYLCWVHYPVKKKRDKAKTPLIVQNIVSYSATKSTSKISKKH